MSSNNSNNSINRVLVVIPHYNHETTIERVAKKMQAFDLDVLIVDDGSDKRCRPILEQLNNGNNGIPKNEHSNHTIRVVFREENGGKGSAMKTGIHYAQHHDYTHILQVDADGQHHLDDTPKFLQSANENPQAVICGLPKYGNDAPKSRLYGRKITDFWNMVHTHSTDIKDGMCGFRLYPVQPFFDVIEQEYVGERMDFDVEILIHLYWRGVRLIWIETPVQYQVGGISHFRAWQDNVLISKMHTRLFFGMLKRWIFGGGVRQK